MPTLQAMWVHGTAAIPERTIKSEPFGTEGPLMDIPGFPGSGMLGLPRGSGKTFRGKGNSGNEHDWFHFAIPTPVIHEGARANLKTVFLLFRADPQVLVEAIHVWDGGNRRIFESTMPHGVTGDHGGQLGLGDIQSNITAWALPNAPEVMWGIDVGVLVRFNREGNITFCAAGADFDVDPLVR